MNIIKKVVGALLLLFAIIAILAGIACIIDVRSESGSGEGQIRNDLSESYGNSIFGQIGLGILCFGFGLMLLIASIIVIYRSRITKAIN